MAAKCRCSDPAQHPEGCAGELARHGEVLVVTKESLGESNTHYAQGGIAVATEGDADIALHFEDTVNAGDGIVYRPAADGNGDAPTSVCARSSPYLSTRQKSSGSRGAPVTARIRYVLCLQCASIFPS